MFGVNNYSEEDVQVYICSMLEICLRDEDEAEEVQLHVYPVDRLLVQDDQPWWASQEYLLCCGEKSKPKVPEGKEPITQLNVVEFLWVGLNSMVERVEAFVLNAINNWTGSFSTKEEFPLVDCPIGCFI